MIGIGIGIPLSALYAQPIDVGPPILPPSGNMLLRDDSVFSVMLDDVTSNILLD